MATESDLQTFKQQQLAVENALLLDPGNQELIKLKEDLDELIKVSGVLATPNDETEGAQDKWAIGDVCEAMWLADGNYYRAIIDTVSADGRSATVTFTQYGETQECNVSRLRKSKETTVRVKATGTAIAGDKGSKGKSQSKKDKKRNRLAELEKAREGEKQRWLDFSRGISKRNKSKASIFATTEEGKVGVTGSGRGMTDFDRLKKWAPSTKLSTIALPPANQS